MTHEQRLRSLRSFFGEFVVIVVGVLVALGVDQWRGAREDRVLENRYLERLKAGLQWDTTNFGSFERTALAAKTAVLRDLLAEDPIARLTARPNLMEDLNYSSFVALPANRPATFEELQSTGHLSLLQDLELRGALSHYYSGFDHISRILAQPFSDYRQRLFAALPGEAIHDWRLNRDAASSDEIALALRRILTRPGLEGAVNAELSYTAAMSFYLREYRQQAVQLLNRLDRP